MLHVVLWAPRPLYAHRIDERLPRGAGYRRTTTGRRSRRSRTGVVAPREPIHGDEGVPAGDSHSPSTSIRFGTASSSTRSSRLRSDPSPRTWETAAGTTFSCSFPVAGAFDVPQATVRLENSQQMVAETVAVENDQRLRVDSRQPRNLHLGQDGGRISASGED